MTSTLHRQTARVPALSRSLAPGPSQAVTAGFQRVAEGGYGHVGNTGARKVDNEGPNANIGVVVTPSGAVLIDSGATAQRARQIHAAAAPVHAQLIRCVINTGGQDHRGPGNSHFLDQGAKVLPHANAAGDVRDRGNDPLQGLTALGPKAQATVPTLPARLIEGADARIEVGGIAFELRHHGGAHPRGNVVCVDSLPGVIPVGNTRPRRSTPSLFP